MSNAIDTQPAPEDSLRDVVNWLVRQMEVQQAEIEQLNAERATNLGTSSGRKSPRETTLQLYDEILKHYPAIDMPDFYNAELPRNHNIFDWNEFHFTEGMEYKAPPVLHHAEVTLSNLSKQHDQDLATVQGRMAHTTRILDSLAHELIELGANDTNIGDCVFDYLNIARISIANDASRISRMRVDIYYSAMGINSGSGKDKAVLTPEDVDTKEAPSDLFKKAYLKLDPPKDMKKKRFDVTAWRNIFRADDVMDRKSSRTGRSRNKSSSAGPRCRRTFKPGNMLESDSRNRLHKQQSDMRNDEERSAL
ncbi:hypothetical protein BGW41_003865 [Actinomortierella wolfii]|nr:hypothetical protein BGW41_003865 [Actinomortierella wolfii]